MTPRREIDLRPPYAWPAWLTAQRVVASTCVLGAACGIAASTGTTKEIVANPALLLTPWTNIRVAIQWPLVRVAFEAKTPLGAALRMGAANAALAVAERLWLTPANEWSPLYFAIAAFALTLGSALLFAPFMLAVHETYRRPLFDAVERALVVGGMWLIGLLFLLLAMGSTEPLVLGLGVPLAGLVASIGASIGFLRRRWLACVRRGEVQGWLVENDAEGEQLVRLQGADDSYRAAETRLLVARVTRRESAQG